MITGFGLLGAGAQADEIAAFASPEPIVFRAVDREYLRAEEADVIDIANPPIELRAMAVVGAVGAPALRRDMVTTWPGSRFHTIVAPTAWIAPSASIGEGSIIAPGCVISTSVVIGEHCLVNLGATISHDTSVGEFTTVSPGVHIAGHCVIGSGVFLGVGAVVSNRISIVDGTVVGAGAVVVDDITEVGVYVGVPARRIPNTEGWLREL